MYPTTFVPSLHSPSASSLPGILLWPGTQFRETELLAATSLILLSIKTERERGRESDRERETERERVEKYIIYI